MPFTIERFPDEPIVLVVYENPFDFQHDLAELKGQLSDLVANVPGTVCAIHDIRSSQNGFDAVAVGLAASFESDDAYLEPRVRTIVVGTGSLAKPEAEGNGKASGLPVVGLYDTPGEALAYARVHLAVGC
jgi:hypothetical protein